MTNFSDLDDCRPVISQPIGMRPTPFKSEDPADFKKVRHISVAQGVSEIFEFQNFHLFANRASSRVLAVSSSGFQQGALVPLGSANSKMVWHTSVPQTVPEMWQEKQKKYPFSWAIMHHQPQLPVPATQGHQLGGIWPQSGDLG